MLNPLRATKMANTRTEGGKGGADDTCDHGLSKSWKVTVGFKEKTVVPQLVTVGRILTASAVVTVDTPNMWYRKMSIVARTD